MDNLSNMQFNQKVLDEAPVDGGDGYIGAETGKPVGFDMISGKQGSVTSKPIWGTQTDYTKTNTNTGSGDVSFGGQDSTDEFAGYKKVQTDEGLPQTYRDSYGAGDATPAGADEPDKAGGVFGKGGSNQGNPDTQSTPSATPGEHPMSDMPQTEFTHNDGGGAPSWKR